MAELLNGPWNKYKTAPQDSQYTQSGPWDKYKTASVDDQQSPSIIQETELGSAEIPGGVRAKLGFASTLEGKKGLLEKEYPGIQFANLPSKDPKEQGEMVVKVPGASRYMRIDDPNFTSADIADFAGDVPSVLGGIGAGLLAAPTGPGAILAAGAGSAAGEVGRKAIGRGIFGIEDKAPLKEDIKDVAQAGLFGMGGQAAGQYVLGPALKYGAKKVGGLFSQGAAEATEQAGKELAGDIPPPGGPSGSGGGGAGVSNVAEIPQFKTEGILQGQTIKNLDDVSKWAKQAPYMGDAGELLSSEHLEGILKRNPDLAQKFPDIYRQLAKSQTEKDIVGLMEQLPNKMKDNLIRLKDSTERNLKGGIDDVVKTTGADLKATRGDIGRKTLEQVGNTYDNVKKEAGPLFERIKNTKFPYQEHVPELRKKLVGYLSEKGDSYEDWAKYINIDQKGKLILAPKNQITNVTGKEYGVIKDLIGKLNNKQVTFSELQAMRANLLNNMDNVNPQNTRKLSVIREALFDHMKDMGDKKLPPGYVKDTFKKWAMNEKYIDDAETLFGGKLKDISQEKVLDRVFRDSNNVRVAKQVLGEKGFNDMAGNYVNQIVQESVDRATGRLQAGALDRALNSKKDVLIEAIGLERTQKLLDTAALMRVMKYVPNPSGTGQAVATNNLFSGKGLMDIATQHPFTTVKDVTSGLLNKRASNAAEAAAEKEIGGLLGTPVNQTKKGLLTRVKEKVINDKTKAGASRIVGGSGGLLRPESNND